MGNTGSAAEAVRIWRGSVRTRVVRGVSVEVAPMPYALARRVIEAESAEDSAERLAMMAEAVRQCCTVGGEALEPDELPVEIIAALFRAAADLPESAENFTPRGATT